MALASQASVVPASPPVQASAASLQLAQLEAQIEQQSGSLGPSHPVMQDLNARRASIAAVVAKEQAASHTASTGVQRAAAVDRALEAQKSRVIAQRDKVERLRQLESEVTLRREQYRKTAARAADLQIEAAVADPGISPLGVVVQPTKPTFPNRPLMLGGSVALGGALGLALALLIELLNRRVRGVEDLTGSLNVPCLAVVRGPVSASQGGLLGVLRALLPRKVAPA
jgi:polysaccharide biosynthesis transport protein